MTTQSYLSRSTQFTSFKSRRRQLQTFRDDRETKQSDHFSKLYLHSCSKKDGSALVPFHSTLLARKVSREKIRKNPEFIVYSNL